MGPLLTIIAIVILILLIILIVFIVAGLTAAGKRLIQNLGASVLSDTVTVVDKRTHVYGQSGNSSTRYFVTFELPDRSRLEFRVIGTVYGQLTAGDTGVLTWRGTWFKGFQREILR
jgi:hypothetical protein